MIRHLAFRLVLLILFGLSGCVHLDVLEVRNQAEQLYKEGRTAEIIPLVESAMVRVEKELGPDHPYLGEGYNALAVLYAYTLNDFERAHDYFQRALAIRTKALGPEHPDTIETLNLMGFLYQVTGDLDKADASFRRALEVRSRVLGPDHPDTADSQVYLAGLDILLGKYDEAESLLLEAVENEAQEVSTRYPSPADSHALLGTLYYTLGDIERSEQYHLAALEIRERELSPDHAIVAMSLVPLAIIAAKKDDFERAEQLGVRALRINEENFGRLHGFTGDSLLFLGTLRRSQDDLDGAADYMRQAREIYEKVVGPDNARTLLAKLYLASLHLANEEPERAKTLCEEVLASPGLTPVPELHWPALTLYSIALYRTGKPRTAILYGKQAVNIIQGMRTTISSFDQGLQRGFVLGREGAFRHLAALLVEEGRLPEAQQVLTMIKEEERFDFVRRNLERGSIRKTTASYSPVEETWVRRYREISDRLAGIGSEFERLRQKKKAGLEAVDEARLAQMHEDLVVAKRAFRQFLAELEQELETVSRRRAMEIASKNLENLKALQGTLRDLGDDVVLVHYLITEDKLYAILTTPRVQIVRKVAVARSELNQRVYQLRQAFDDPAQFPLPEARAVYDLIIAPLASDLQQAGARTLMFSMDGVLRYVPVAALHDGKQFLVERYNIALFTEAAQTKLISRPSEQWSLAGLGVTRAVEDFSPLPSVEIELNSIVRTDADDQDGVLPGVIYLDEQFTTGAMTEVLDEEYPVLHVASHFVFQPGTERDSYLLLGDGNHLSLAQILDQDMDFNSVELLTLSACETALGGANADGREVEGFGWLAQRQGAKAVLATLWPVADESTALFMQSLYAHLQSGGMTKAEALRQTQIEFIRSSEYAHPNYWAPFILMGNWL